MRTCAWQQACFLFYTSRQKGLERLLQSSTCIHLHHWLQNFYAAGEIILLQVCWSFSWQELNPVQRKHTAKPLKQVTHICHTAIIDCTTKIPALSRSQLHHRNIKKSNWSQDCSCFASVTTKLFSNVLWFPTHSFNPDGCTNHVAAAHNFSPFPACRQD